MLVGMGPDGHVASLFPGHPLLKENQKWVAHITDSPKPPPERITFTFPVINSSAYIALVVCGAGKAGIVQTALGTNQNSEVFPVQMVSPEGELRWFLDKDAASKLLALYGMALHSFLKRKSRRSWYFILKANPGISFLRIRFLVLSLSHSGQSLSPLN
ncbi:hypothetical protein OIU84_007659 [Salix udensis]|uniref:Glucosamine/galactosamine-6-phosphate isomerase domain-containing protein n=1 Tax=Salix udensis TaxID=889485 RepID=A0AAD6NZN9_9ROSI|nr:hypothetical protein OIU84_007659 [Salix udensis]